MLPARAVFSAKFKSKGKNRSARSLCAAPARTTAGRPPRRFLFNGRSVVYFMLCAGAAACRAEKTAIFRFFNLSSFHAYIYTRSLTSAAIGYIITLGCFADRAEDGAPPGAKYVRSARERNVL